MDVDLILRGGPWSVPRSTSFPRASPPAGTRDVRRVREDLIAPAETGLFGFLHPAPTGLISLAAGVGEPALTVKSGRRWRAHG
jgi:hypothetical protein